MCKCVDVIMVMTPCSKLWDHERPNECVVITHEPWVILLLIEWVTPVTELMEDRMKLNFHCSWLGHVCGVSVYVMQCWRRSDEIISKIHCGTRLRKDAEVSMDDVFVLEEGLDIACTLLHNHNEWFVIVASIHFNYFIFNRFINMHHCIVRTNNTISLVTTSKIVHSYFMGENKIVNILNHLLTMSSVLSSLYHSVDVVSSRCPTHDM